jgi:hypothetical protein
MAQKKSLDYLMGTNIQARLFQGNPFFHTISSKANWEAKGKEYISPQATAFEYCEDVVLLVRETDKGKEYGGMALEELRNVVCENHHLYEILKGKLKPYFDIEFEFSNNEEKVKKIGKIWKIIHQTFKLIDIKWNFQEGIDFYSEVIGTGEQGSFAGIKKYSAHMVINNGYYFNNCDDADVERKNYTINGLSGTFMANIDLERQAEILEEVSKFFNDTLIDFSMDTFINVENLPFTEDALNKLLNRGIKLHLYNTHGDCKEVIRHKIKHAKWKARQGMGVSDPDPAPHFPTGAIITKTADLEPYKRSA